MDCSLRESWDSVDEIDLRLTQDEGLVLYDWLARTTEADGPVPFEDQAEQRVLWDIEAMLEPVLPLLDRVNSTRPTYQEQLLEARAKVRDQS